MLPAAGRVVLVSGANRGIGNAIAMSLYEAGYTLSLGARQPKTLDPLTADWDSSRFACHRYDAEDRQSQQQWVETTAQRFQRIDGLVNNAGMVIRVTLDEENDAALDQMWAVNVKAPLAMIRLCLPHLRRSGHGRVINVASIAGKAVYNNNVGYAMSKFAAVALSHATRIQNWDAGVRCTALCPSFVATDMTSDVTTFPLEDMMDSDDIATLVTTIIGLPNSASIAELIVNCRKDAML